MLPMITVKCRCESSEDRMAPTVAWNRVMADATAVSFA